MPEDQATTAPNQVGGETPADSRFEGLRADINDIRALATQAASQAQAGKGPLAEQRLRYLQSKRDPHGYILVVLLQIGIPLLLSFMGMFPLWMVFLFESAAFSTTSGMAWANKWSDDPYHSASIRGKLVYASIVVTGFCVAAMTLGGVILVLMQMWTFWTGALIAGAYIYLGFDAYFGVGVFKKRKRLESRMKTYQGRQPPDWIAQIAGRGWNNWTVENGTLQKKAKKSRVRRGLEALGGMARYLTDAHS